MPHNHPAVRPAPSTLRRFLTSRAVMLLVGLGVLALVLTRWVEGLGGPAGVWDRMGLWAPAVTVPFHAVVAVTPLPSDVVSIANGTVYGFPAGALLNWLGWYLASFVQYGLGRRLGADLDAARWMARSPAFLRRFSVGHPVFLILARYVPVAGGHLSTLLPGAAGVSLLRFAGWTALALVPPSLVMAALGAGLLML